MVVRCYFCRIRIIGRSIAVSSCIRIVNVIATVSNGTSFVVWVMTCWSCCIMLVICRVLLVVLMIGSMISFIIVMMVGGLSSVLVSSRLLRRRGRRNGYR